MPRVLRCSRARRGCRYLLLGGRRSVALSCKPGRRGTVANLLRLRPPVAGQAGSGRGPRKSGTRASGRRHSPGLGLLPCRDASCGHGGSRPVPRILPCRRVVLPRSRAALRRLMLLLRLVLLSVVAGGAGGSRGGGRGSRRGPGWSRRGRGRVGGSAGRTSIFALLVIS